MEAVAVPLEQLPVHDDEGVHRMAEVLETLGYSSELQYGYGMGEAVLFAVRVMPQRMRPLIERAGEFTHDQLRGVPDAPDVEAAVRARNELLHAVREIVAAHPKRHRGNS